MDIRDLHEAVRTFLDTFQPSFEPRKRYNDDGEVVEDLGSDALPKYMAYVQNVGVGLGLGRALGLGN